MPGYVYILRDARGRFYVGSTADAARRLKEHARGTTHTTHRMVNPTVVFIQEYKTLAIARKIEMRIKKLRRKDYIQKMIADGEIRICL